jgi:hypothetical protein
MPRADSTPPDTQPSTPLGERALEVFARERAAGVREIPGPTAHNERVLDYFAGCVRDGQTIGKWLNTDEHHWCAAGASWAAFQARRAGEAVPHEYRAAVRELWADAVAAHAARSATAVRHGIYMPSPGDLWIGTRGGTAATHDGWPFAKSQGKGHVARVSLWHGDGTLQTLDANSGDRWRFVEREIGAQQFVGIIAYPRPEVLAVAPGDEEIEGLRHLFELQERIQSGVDTALVRDLYDV